MLKSVSTHDAIATAFIEARAAGLGLADYPGTIPETLEGAYAVQDRAIGRTLDAIAGWKVGRIFPPLSEHYQSERLAGPIFTGSLRLESSGERAVGRIFANGFGAAEAEFLMRIGEQPSLEKTHYSLLEASALIDRVHIGIEIASSPLISINDLGPAAIISDFGNNNGLLIGAEIEGWQSSGLSDWPVTTLVDGDVVGSGKASAFPDGPIGSVRFLLELMAKRGIALPAGSWISTGAVSGVHVVKHSQKVEARFGDYHKMCCIIEAI